MSRLFSLVLASALLVAGGWWAPASAAYATQAGPSWVPNGNVKVVTRAGGTVYIGGAFTSLKDPVTGQTVARNHVAALDAATGAPLAWNPGADGSVEAVGVATDGTVYLGGAFANVAGSPAARVAAVEPDGSLLPGFKGSANSTVFDLQVTDTSLYLGGAFASINGKNRPKLAKVDRLTGALDTGFSAGVTGGRVMTVEMSEDGSSVLLGGAFTSVGGQPRTFVASVAAADGAVGTWAPSLCATCSTWDLVASGGTVYGAIGGPGGKVVAWDPTTANARWTKSADGNVQAVDVQGGVVYAGGHFGPTFAGQTRHQLAALDATNGSLLDYALDFTGRDYPGIWSLDADATGLSIGGGFTLNGNPAKKYASLPFTP